MSLQPVDSSVLSIHYFSPEPNPIHQAIFCHEMGTWVYVWGVILTATERLLNSFNFRLRVGYSVFLVLSPFLALLIFGTSYFCTSLLLSGLFPSPRTKEKTEI